MTLPTWLYVIFAAIYLAGMSNAVNLTDGLDGLAIGPVMINAGTYGILAYVAGVVVLRQRPGRATSTSPPSRAPASSRSTAAP